PRIGGRAAHAGIGGAQALSRGTGKCARLVRRAGVMAMKGSGMRLRALIAAVLAMVIAAPAMAKTPEQIAQDALRAAPVWDGHNDAPIQLRGRYGNVINEFNF